MRRQYDRFLAYVDAEIAVQCHSWRDGFLGPDVWEGAAALCDLFRRTDENYLPNSMTFWTF